MRAPLSCGHSERRRVMLNEQVIAMLRADVAGLTTAVAQMRSELDEYADVDAAKARWMERAKKAEAEAAELRKEVVELRYQNSVLRQEMVKLTLADEPEGARP
jgi:predicted  nucleic acid-binding Zn-ribbon protein